MTQTKKLGKKEIVEAAEDMKLWLEQNSPDPVLNRKRASLNIEDIRNMSYIQRRCAQHNPVEEKLFVVGSLTDYFGDGIIGQCVKCGEEIVFRPWLHELIIKYNLEVVCASCASELPTGAYSQAIKINDQVKKGKLP